MLLLRGLNPVLDFKSLARFLKSTRIMCAKSRLWSFIFSQRLTQKYFRLNQACLSKAYFLLNFWLNLHPCSFCTLFYVFFSNTLVVQIICFCHDICFVVFLFWCDNYYRLGYGCNKHNTLDTCTKTNTISTRSGTSSYYLFFLLLWSQRWTSIHHGHFELFVARFGIIVTIIIWRPRQRFFWFPCWKFCTRSNLIF